MSLFNELKRRKVFRVAVVYAATAFAVLQGADVLLPNLGVPEWVMPLLSAVVVLGFPIAMVLAWALELRPDGTIHRTEGSDDKAESAPALLGTGTLVAAALLVAVGVGLSAGWLLKPESNQVEQDRATDVSELERRASIAVLAFENMSPDPDNAFFAEGISEEILNALVRVEGLKIASRTSAFSLSRRDTSIPEIADTLGVRHVLEGSVRKAGNRVRITAQLIDADDDSHLWSDVYDRELDDIFAVQEEIARAITSELSSILDSGSGAVTITASTRDMVAYQAFLRGRSRFHQRSQLDTAIEDLRSAVSRDTNFAEAWAFLAATEHVLGYSGWRTELDRGELRRQAVQSADRALSLDPELAIAKAVKGRLLVDEGGRDGIERGLRLLEAAASVRSADSTAPLWYGSSHLLLGHPNRARQVLAQAQQQDPLVPINNGNLAVAHAGLGQGALAQRYALRSVELSGSQTYWVQLLAIDLANSGDAAAAITLLSQAQTARVAGPGPFTGALIQALSDKLSYEEFVRRHQATANPISTIAALLLGDLDAALSPSMGLADDGRYHTLLFVAWLPSMASLREHAAFFDFVRELGFVDYWRANGFPLDCREFEGDGPARLDCGGGA